MKAVVAAFNQEKALVGAFSVITNLRMELFEPLVGGDLGGAQVVAGVRCGDQQLCLQSAVETADTQHHLVARQTCGRCLMRVLDNYCSQELYSQHRALSPTEV